MSRQITQPVNQVRLTNVAVVRMNKNGKRFEVAAYRNKVVNYRQGTETDLSEVLQTERIFANVSKGQFAKSSDLKKAFDTKDEEAIAKIILSRGDLQVSDLERSSQLNNTILEIASMVAARCVDPRSNRPYTVRVIREAMKSCGFRVKDKRSVKQQFLDCVKLIKESGVLPIERAKMELRAVFTVMAGSDISKEMRGVGAEIVSSCNDFEGSYVTMLVDPSLYRQLDQIVKIHGGRLEIVRQCVTEQGDVNLESEIQRIDQINHHETAAAAAAAATATTLELNNKLDSLHLNDTTTSTPPPNTNDDPSEDDDHNNNTPNPTPTNPRKDQKKAQKKSKKAKRREKEDAKERDERIKKEDERQKERRRRLHLDSDDDDADKKTTRQLAATEGEERSKSCNTCGGAFTMAEYRGHFRSDWHRYNLNLKLKGVKCVSEEEFKACEVDAFFEGGMM